MFKKQPKYFSKKTCCGSKHMHDSREEADYCDSLSMLKRAGDIKDFNIQYTFELIVNDVLICKHIVDFYVLDLQGKWSVHEVKMPLNRAPRDFKLKHKLFRALYPEISYYLIEKEDWYGQRRSKTYFNKR